jgi:hypothetical protein
MMKLDFHGLKEAGVGRTMRRCWEIKAHRVEDRHPPDALAPDFDYLTSCHPRKPITEKQKNRERMTRYLLEWSP